MKLDALFSQKEEVRIGYFGGSITEGAGVENKALCYRGLVTSWLKSRYPHQRVTEIQGGIGGTGSDLGAFRLQRDLLAHRPDLCVIEFAVNDESTDPQLIGLSMEGIVRQMLVQNPSMLLFFLLTTTKGKNDTYYAKGIVPPANRVHEQVAAHYHIPVLNVGYQLYQHLLKTGEDVTCYLGDTVHPNEKGYLFYSRLITAFLENTDFQIEYKAPLFSENFEHTQLLPAKGFATPGWRYCKNMRGRYDGFIESGQEGDSFTVPFTGRGVGIYYTVDKDSGDLFYQIDGGEKIPFSCFDHYALSFDRANYKVFDYQLASGPHTLTITAAGTKDPRSLGTFVRVGAILIVK